MAKKTQTADVDLVKALGNEGASAFDEHKADETKVPGGGSLPAGIDNGIAQLVECKFDTYKKGDMEGKVFFYAAGVVKSPKSIKDEDGNVFVVEGKRTSIREPLCETEKRTRKTVSEHMAWILNQLRLLGVETKGLKFSQIQAAAKALVKAGPHFSFRTWKGEKQTTGPYAGQEPRVQETWEGACDFDEDESGSSVEVDEEPTADDLVGDSEEVDSVEETGEEVDWKEIAEKADSDDEEAATKLSSFALSKGINEDDINNAPSWVAVFEMLGISAAEEADADTQTWAETGASLDEAGAETDEAMEAAAAEAGGVLRPGCKGQHP